MARIVIIEKDFDGHEMACHYYSGTPKGKLIEDVTKLDEIVGGKTKFYATGMGIKLQVFPKLQPVIRKLEVLMARELVLDVDYEWQGGHTATAGSPHGRGYSERYEE